MKRYLVEVKVTLTKLYDITATNELEAVQVAAINDRIGRSGIFNPLVRYSVAESSKVKQELSLPTTGAAE